MNKSMPCVVCITNGPVKVDSSDYNYHEYDRILKNIDKDQYEVFYSGQNKGKLDYQLINAIQKKELFKVYYRCKKGISYTYMGETYSSNIIQYRKLPIDVDTNTDQRLQIHLIINNIENISVPIKNISGLGRYKKDVLIHTGLRDINDNSIIKHNGNISIGFYYYSEF